VRVVATVVLVLCGCRAPVAAPSAPKPVVPASTLEAKPALESVWPELPPAPPGTTYRTVHAKTIHVAVAVPKGASVETSSLPFGHPVVYVTVGSARLSITFSSGRNVFMADLAKSPPMVASLPVERIVTTPENTAVLFRRKSGELVVNGWVRAAECIGESLQPTEVDLAFSVCASLRVPPPGPLHPGGDEVDKPFPPIPEGAYVSREYGVTQLYAGQFAGKVLAKPCPTEDELHAAWPKDDLHLERKDYPHGSVLVSREEASYEGAHYRAATTVWAMRHAHCCIATIPEAFTPPTEAQVDYVARWCDATN
jgi:hypothetical protein